MGTQNAEFDSDLNLLKNLRKSIDNKGILT